MSEGAIRAGKAFVELGIKDNLATGLNAASTRLKAWGAGLAAVGGLATAAGTAILGTLGAAVKHFADTGSAINDMSVRTGVSRKELAALGYAAEQSGASLEAVGKAILHQQKAGIAGTFQQVAARIAAIQDPAERTRAAFEAWGKAAEQLLPVLPELQSLMAEGGSIFGGLSEQDWKNADALGDAIGKITKQFSTIALEVGAALAPTLLNIAGIVSSILQPVVEWVNENRALVVTVAAIGAGLAVAGTAVVALGAALGTAGAVFAGIGVALPVITAIAPAVFAVTAAVAALTLTAAAFYALLRSMNVSIIEFVKKLGELAMAATRLSAFGPFVALVERLAPQLRTMVGVIGMAATALSAQAQAAFTAADGMRAYAGAIDEANQGLSIHQQMLQFIEAGQKRRLALAEQFLTADERGARKEREILDALKEVHNLRLTGMLNPQEAGFEEHNLKLALARHRAAEDERRRVGGVQNRLPDLNHAQRFILGSSTAGAFNAASKGLLKFSGESEMGQLVDVNQDQLQQLKDMNVKLDKLNEIQE